MMLWSDDIVVRRSPRYVTTRGVVLHSAPALTPVFLDSHASPTHPLPPTTDLAR